jgi:phosphoribosylanthranilate isomerase
MMVKVKICGVTAARDALWAVRCGADALGFIFVSSSPRCIEPEKARPIVMSLPPFVSTVGVFLDAHPDRVAEVMDFCGLDYAQLHGAETPRQCEQLRGRRLIKAFRIAGEEELRELARYQVDAYLLDTYVKGQPGGTGRTFDWSIARAAGRQGNVILAGGLRPDNVAEAVRVARPYAVDVAGGVEREPGKKSRSLVEKFIRHAKSVEL